MINTKMDFVEKVSPFAAYDGEKVVRVLPQTYCHYIQLNEVQQNIILAVNKCLLINSYLLQRYLEKAGCSITGNELNQELRRLSENNYLEKMEFQYNGEKIGCKVYRVGRKGRGWLAGMGEKIRLTGYIDQCEAVQIKKILSANQAVIELMDEQGLEEIIPGQIVKCDGNGISAKYIFRAYGYMESGRDTCIVEPVRNEENAIANLKEKLGRIEAVLKKGAKANIVIKNEPTVLLVAENRYMMECLMKNLERSSYKTFHLAFSYDGILVSGLNKEDKLFYQVKKSFWERLLAG